VGFFIGYRLSAIGCRQERLADSRQPIADSYGPFINIATEENMSELIQEFVTSGNLQLRVDREAGVIRGVKLLGLSSRNGRRYLTQALTDAIGLYEGAKVNINHPKGHPLAPRDYQDRLGVVRGVAFRPGEGLFGDLHFNPRHSLSEQLVWDAEHAPQNVGMSHNVLARTKQHENETVVEAITKVQSIDLVADPATTSGLFEQEEEQQSGRAEEQQTFDALTLEHLRVHRPDLVREIEQARDEEITSLRRQLDEAVAREAIARRPKSRDQLTVGGSANLKLVRTAAEFAAAVRGA
jgi:hypothetical protein